MLYSIQRIKYSLIIIYESILDQNYVTFCKEIYGIGPTIEIYTGRVQSKRWLIYIRYKRRRKEDLLHHPPPL